jgi:hypothetical protein
MEINWDAVTRRVKNEAFPPLSILILVPAFKINGDHQETGLSNFKFFFQGIIYETAHRCHLAPMLLVNHDSALPISCEYPASALNARKSMLQETYRSVS